MPANAPVHPPLFDERLRVPLRWWLIASAGVAVGGAEIFAGFDWRVAAAVYAVMAGCVALLLIAVGRPRVRVDADGLHAGDRTLPLPDIASATVLDAAETRERLGPGADPAAHVVARGFVRESVLVRPAGGEGAPYWLLSTRHPKRLLAALERAGAVTR